MKEQQIYYGDNLDIMRKYIPDETIDLCYIDPPFNSNRNYNQIYNNIGQEDKAQAVAFVDTWEWNARAEKEYGEICANENGGFTKQTSDLIIGLQKILGKGSLMSYLVSMTLRINEIHRVLKPTGSFYLHCDPTVSHYLKIVLDAVFCRNGGDFKNEIIWHYRRWTGKAKRFQQLHDTIFFYTKSFDYTFNTQFIDYTEGSTERKLQGKLHRFKKGEEPLLVSNKDISEKGVRDNDVWQIPFIAPSAKERLGYPTQKPEALLEKIIKASSNEGDTVLDAYCGCGTTVAVAQRLNRKWVGIDITYQSIALIIKRLTEAYGSGITDNILMNGIPADIESAEALAQKADDRLRKEFEKWAILTYTNSRAMPNNKKGRDYGIDGVMRILEGKEQYRDVLFSVKSGKVNSAMIRDFRGVIERENAAAGIFITLKEPTKDMKQEAAAAGFYSNDYIRELEKIKIVTVRQILDGARTNVPLAAEALKKALPSSGTNQTTFF
ncbi:MAG: restriction endonuclease [Oscillospiraceae bacterium]|nr:restriction endonuclease [Oscillospiraceae bacterium]